MAVTLSAAVVACEKVYVCDVTLRVGEMVLT
jgi:hypothetical protein